MKMAKASTADIEMAMELSRFVEDLVDGMCPKQACADPASDDIEWLEDDPDEQHIRIISALQGIARKGSIFRVTFGMSVLIDPRNELIDHEADTLEPHPKIGILADQVEALQLALETERAAANLYAKQVAHWIEKHDALLAQQLEASESRDAYAEAADTMAAAHKVERDALKAAARLALDTLEGSEAYVGCESWSPSMLREVQGTIAALKAVL